MCLHRKCVSIPPWEGNCSPDTCNDRGVCNNKHHCHCNYGWDPPFCLNKGNGGSIDSGPSPKKKKFPVYIFIFIWLIALPLCTGLVIWFLYIQSSKEKEEITETASVIEEQDFETSPVKEEQKVETSPEKVEQKVETSPVKEEQNVEISK
jgi:cytoskeletal protein RodZ